ncbi:IucA/IucC family protein [Pontibacterium granulatum]|uniref:IucA/IucC family protein n=1 Tax=Pontibacterium granulatum TaxID=2036029 RepID=UPI00249C9EC5|nr:IucA/IucC family protein [Pontibacterium granulatum]MDI3324541.1 IucA/IucC family protein [Pontibacterium granulatum]
MDPTIAQNTYDVNSFPALQRFQVQATRKCLQQLLQAALREQMLSFVDRGTGELVVPMWRSRAMLLLKGVRQVSLCRFEGFEGIELIGHGSAESRELNDVQELLALLAVEAGACLADNDWRTLKEELNNGIFNNAMCLAYRRRWNDELAQQVKDAGCESFWLWVRAGGVGSDPALFFEQWAAIGHPYHPCSKTKLGLRPAEVLQYSPEFRGGASVRLAAVRRSHLHVQLRMDQADTAVDWLADHYPEWLAQWQAELAQRGFDADEYAPVPVHHWQAETVIPRRFAADIAANHICMLDGPEMTTGATMSFRTMAPINQPLAPHIKLPVAVQATSAVRTVSPASVQTGPQVTEILQQICARDEHIGTALRILPESVGMHLRRPGADVHDDDMRFLSVLFRGSPASCIEAGEIALAVAALFVDSPVTREPLLKEILTAAGADDEPAIMQYFADYASRVLAGHLDLFLRYGIALEAHQQNAVAVFDQQHRLTRVLARDFGGIRIHAPTLAQHGFELKPYPGAVTVTTDAEEVRNKFLHAVLQGHLGEVVLCLHRTFGIAETTLWQCVQQVIVDRFTDLQPHVPSERWQTEYRAILEQDWQLKALTRMRLDETSHHYIYIDLPNPLQGLPDAG